MPGITNRGKFNVLGVTFRDNSIPGSAFAVFLALAADAPTADDNLKTDVSEIAAGNGYTAGGINIARNATDWDVHTEDDGADRALIQILDLVWTASGGNLPASGLGARYAILTDQNVTVGSREMWGFWDLVSDRTVSTGQTLTLQNCEIRLNDA